MKKTVLLYVLLAGCFSFSLAADVPYKSYLYNRWKEPVSTPHFYIPDGVYRGESLGTGAFRTPHSLFVEKTTGDVYVADAGNNRIVRFDRDFNLVRIYEGFKDPHDVFVTETGVIYVADTGNSRIAIIDMEGNTLKTLERPVTDLISEGLPYFPLKLSVDRAGRIYVVAQGINEGLIELDRDGVFKGFFGASRVNVNPIEYIWKMLSTREQRRMMRRFVPTVYNNISIDEEGFVYVTTSALGYWEIMSAITFGNKQVTPVRKLNPKGDDVLRAQDWFPPVGDIRFISRDSTTPGPSTLIDIAIESSGIYHVLDQKRGRVFTYDPDGILISIFGGTGSREGLLRNPAAIEISDGRILVLDTRNASITVYRLSEYGRTVTKAIDDYYSGRYESSLEEWTEASKRNANLEWAYYGIGNALYQQDRYEDAMAQFQIARDRGSFSRAFKHYRKYQAEKLFGWIISGILVTIVAYKLLRRFHKKRARGV